MKRIWAEQALTEQGWHDAVAVGVGDDGRIVSLDLAAPCLPDDQRVGLLLPAPVNAHSHAFQRAMAGLTEARGPDPRDSFWTWRKLMYAFLDRLTPEQVEAIAALVQMEMLEAGYATNVEFHYLHHQGGGRAYDDLGEMAARIAAASQTSGIGLTLLPVHYQYGGCDRRDLVTGQDRFGNDLDRFGRLYQRCEALVDALPTDARLGLAPHSLRAVAPEQLASLFALTDGPIHMHLAEQPAEVSEVKAALGLRPVEWVLEALAPDPRYTFIHCTQMLPHETQGLAQSGAVAGLCPITESSLGDGIFDGLRWFEAGGRISVGSDSNIRIALAEELRTLDYSQRLRDGTRAALASAQASTGRRLFDAVCAGGAQSAGRKTGVITPGYQADLMALDRGHIDLDGRQGDTLLDSYIFAGDDRMVQEVWAAGRHMVTGGRHIHRAAILAAYRKAIRELQADL